MPLRVVHRPRHKRHPSPRIDFVQELLLVRRHFGFRRFHLDTEHTPVLEDSKDVCDAGGVRRDVGVSGFDENACGVVLPAEDSAIAEVIEDLLLDLLFEDGGVR